MSMLLAVPNPITLLVYLLIAGIVLAVAYYIIHRLFPEPMRVWAWAILITLVAIYAILYILLPLTGGLR